MSQDLGTPGVVIEADAEVGEGPVFDHRTGDLLWVDITRGRIFESDLASGRRTEHAFDTMVGAVAPRASDPGFAVAVSDGFGLVVDGRLDLVDRCLPETYRRMNDAKVDSRGRMWAGSTHMEFQPGVGALHRWDGRGPSTLVRDGFILPNGLGWNAADDRMYLADSFAHTLLVADYAADAGDVGEFRVIAEFGDGIPDGLTIDADGYVWVAMWGGGVVLRFDADGAPAGSVRMPVSQPSSCAFGSDGTLYITSARAGLSPEKIAAEPLAGSVFALATGTRGVPVAPFGA